MAARGIFRHTILGCLLTAVLVLAVMASPGYASDKTPPRINVFQMKSGEIKATNRSVVVRGRVTDAGGVRRVVVDGHRVELKEGRFSRRVMLMGGEKQVLIEAVDLAGNEAEVSVAIVQVKKTRRVSRRRAPSDESDESLNDFDTASGPADDETSEGRKGYFMELMAGGSVVHSTPMPNLEACQKAIEFSPKAKCIYRAAQP